MKNTDVVCKCRNVLVEDVLEYLKNPINQQAKLESKLEDLCIGDGCKQCRLIDCDKIDIHYSEIFKK